MPFVYLNQEDVPHSAEWKSKPKHSIVELRQESKWVRAKLKELKEEKEKK